MLCLNISPPVGCQEPGTPENGFIEPYENTAEGTEIVFGCNSQFVPNRMMNATCGANGTWNNDPSVHRCTCEYPPWHTYVYNNQHVSVGLCNNRDKTFSSLSKHCLNYS